MFWLRNIDFWKMMNLFGRSDAETLSESHPTTDFEAGREMSVAAETSGKTQFLRRAMECGNLNFGDYELKSGRRSPYFFNIGGMSSAADLRLLGETLAEAIIETDDFQDLGVLFGAAYKGIALAALAAGHLADKNPEMGDLGWAHDRKEVKDHGEGGRLVGADVAGKRVLLIDDVLTMGTALRDALSLLKDAGALPIGLLVVFDRKERDEAKGCFVSESLSEELNLPIRNVCDFDDLLTTLDEGRAENPEWERNWRLLSEYRQNA